MLWTKEESTESLNFLLKISSRARFVVMMLFLCNPLKSFSHVIQFFSCVFCDSWVS